MSSAQQLPLPSFKLLETTIADIHAAYKAGTLTVRQLVQAYLDRIAAYDQKGPAINAIISLNPTALEEADRLDAAFKHAGFVGPLHGIPVIMKDQGDRQRHADDARLGAVQGLQAERDCFVVAKLRAGRRHLPRQGDARANSAAATPTARCSARPATSTTWSAPRAARRAARAPRLGEFLRRRGRAGGLCLDPPAVDLERRRRHAPDHGPGQPRRRLRRLADHQRLARPDGAHRHRSRQAAGRHGRLRPRRSGDRRMASAARWRAIRRRSTSAALKGARIGILREPMGYHVEPDSDDFKKVGEVFDRAIADLAQGRRRDRRSDRHSGPQGAAGDARPQTSQTTTRCTSSTSARRHAVQHAQGRDGLAAVRQGRQQRPPPLEQRRQLRRAQHHTSMKARETLMTNMLKVMADHRLDAIVHKAVEHSRP